MNIRPDRLYRLLSDIINIYSPSGKEGELVSYLEGYAHSAGLPLIRQNVEEERDNLLYLPDEEYPQVLFTGHIDTVPPFDYENYKFYDENGEISGLGAADMKGGCAALIEAFLSFREIYGPRIPAALALVVGEEETGDGILRLLEDYHFTWALVGEPTDLQPCPIHYGYMEVQLSTSGKRVHASMANSEHNAIRDMLRLLMRIAEHLDSRGDIIFNIRDVNSSYAGFAVPDRCEARVDIHFPPQYPVGELTVELDELISQNLTGKLKLEDILMYSLIHPGYQLPEKGFLPDTIKRIYRRRKMSWNPGAFRSDSDANLLWMAGVKPVILGPGQLSKAHTQDESISFQQVITASEIYFDLLGALTPQSKTRKARRG